MVQIEMPTQITLLLLVPQKELRGSFMCDLLSTVQTLLCSLSSTIQNFLSSGGLNQGGIPGKFHPFSIDWEDLALFSSGVCPKL